MRVSQSDLISVNGIGGHRKEIATTQDNNGFTIHDFVNDDSKRAWKGKAPFSFKLFGF